MTKISLQFHAEPAELLHVLLPDWLQGMSVQLAWEQFFPDYEIRSTTLSDLAELVADRVSRVNIGLELIDVSAVDQRTFGTHNPQLLRLTPGRLSADGLRESILGAATDDPAALAQWREIVRRAKHSLSKGAQVVNPATGSAADKPNHYYSARARALATQGTTMLAVAGWNRYQLNPSA